MTMMYAVCIILMYEYEKALLEKKGKGEKREGFFT